MRKRFGINGSTLVMGLYLLFLLLPIYWLLNMSLKTNQEILGGFSLFPQDLTLANYAVILTDPSWYMGYVNSMIYVVELLSSLVFEGFGSCGDLACLGGFDAVFERDASDDFGEVIKAA